MRVMIVANNDVGLYKFRRELVEALLRLHEVHICLPDGEYVANLQAMGCVFHPYEFDRHGTNPIAELKQISYYKSLLKSVKPDVVLTYTVKPNVYAGMACASLNIPYMANITGLGTAIANGGLMQKFLKLLYRHGLRKAHTVFFQNEENREFMVSNGIVKDNYVMLPGSGVNLAEHQAEDYPAKEEPLVFVNIGRIMKDKGADEVLYAAKIIRKEYPQTVFRIIGGFDGDYEEQIRLAQEAGDIEYLGQQSDVHAYLKDAHAIIHASYHEGMSNVLLEAAACARPIIATDVAGCRETYDDGVSGIACKAHDGDDLVRAIREFIALSYEQKRAMGLAGRCKVEKEFDRAAVVKCYIDQIGKIR
ncbi:MAG: glycosyltransferase family 4 protein [Ruminococcaceae bacterium]|nr:glycosyltransferase family 4 protein [Oscillospiraceae bacterium]